MMPPICHICNEILEEDSGGLIYFKKTEEDLEWDRRMEVTGMVAHPPYAAWFCCEHHKLAEQYSDLTFSEAMEKIKENL